MGFHIFILAFSLHLWVFGKGLSNLSFIKCGLSSHFSFLQKGIDRLLSNN